LLRPLPKQADEGSSGSDLHSVMDSLRVFRRAMTGRTFSSFVFGLMGTLAVMVLCSRTAAAQQGQPPGSTVHGTVRDRSGKPAGGAHVLLQGGSPPASRETSTDAAGNFTFSGVTPGTFTLSADGGPSGNTAISITVSTASQQPAADLILGAHDTQQGNAASADAEQAIQFADKPDFAIAAVTDSSEAGGHGSDAGLRASEALTREAVKLKPEGAQPAAAASTGAANREEESESALRAAVQQHPRDFEATRRLGLFYLQARRYQDAISSLQTAYQAAPTNFDNELDLARALQDAGDAAQARDHVRRLLARRQSAELHRMEGELDEKLDDPLAAVHAFQQAAGEDPSEGNYFAWGSELLIHRAISQAREVFDEGVRLYPQSARMLAARGATRFAGAQYDEAALDLCKASELNPESTEPYLFMGKVEVAAPNPLPCVVGKLAEFEKRHPENPLAQYYYAMALWKQQGQTTDEQGMKQVKDLLTQAVTLDPKCADASLELGNLSAGQKQWEEAIHHYLNAIQADPELNEAHYRLAVAYRHTGERAKAQEQFQLHAAIASKQTEETEQQRKAVKQFQVVLPGKTAKQ